METTVYNRWKIRGRAAHAAGAPRLVEFDSKMRSDAAVVEYAFGYPWQDLMHAWQDGWDAAMAEAWAVGCLGLSPSV